LPALVLLRKPLFGLAKRRQQPERYAKWGLKFSVNYWKNNLKNNSINSNNVVEYRQNNIRIIL
jgi:hypothetical protein